MPEKTLKGKSLWGTALALFVAACGVKWFYLAQQHYYMVLSNELPGSYDLAKTFEIKDLLRRLFISCDYTLGSCRPFFTNLLYILTFKGFGYEPQVVLVMGVLVGSLLVPLFFLAVNALINVEVALAASVILVWMTNYICQSIVLTTILPGILFIVGALLAAVRYHRKGGIGYLCLSGCLISMSVFCRYENALLLPVFVGYEFFFDQKGGFFSRLIYGLLCASSSLYILYCNYHLHGDFFYIIRLQTAAALMARDVVPVSWAKAFEMGWELLLGLMGLGPLPWVAAVAGAVFMIKRHKFRALWMFLGVLLLLLFQINQNNTFGLSGDHFFLSALVALPLGLECVRAFFSGVGRRRIWGVIALGVVVVCCAGSYYRENLQRFSLLLKDSRKEVRLTETLKMIPGGTALYLDDDLNRFGLATQTVLVYLKRDPLKFQYVPGQTKPSEKEYYLLTLDSHKGNVPIMKAVKVRDYGAYGFEGVVLYRVTQSPDGK